VSRNLFRDRTLKMECADISSWHAFYRTEKWLVLVNGTTNYASDIKELFLS